MATHYYVRPSGGTGGGTSYADAFNGWSSTAVNALGNGDTLWVCDHHDITAGANPSGSGISGSPRTIRGDTDNAPDSGAAGHDGSITSTTNIIGLNNRSWWIFRDLTLLSTGSTGVISMNNEMHDLVFLNLDVSCTGGPGLFWNFNVDTADWYNILFDTCTIHDCATDGFRARMTSASLNSTIDSLTFRDCTSKDNGGSGIDLQIRDVSGTAGVAAKFSNIEFDNCEITGNYERGIYAHDGRDGGSDGSGTGTSISEDIRVVNCNISGNGLNGSGAAGGLIVQGFKSSTNAFGKNLISGNMMNHNIGPNSALNVFWNEYLIIEDNQTNYSTINTGSVDGNGILIDYRNSNLIARRNESSHNTGLTEVPVIKNSGIGIMVLGGTNIEVYNNFGIGNKVGIYASSPSPNININIYNNTFLECFDTLIRIRYATDATDITFANNILTGSVGTEDIINNEVATDIVMNNNMFWDASGGYVSQADLGNDLYDDPGLDANYFPSFNSPVVDAGTTKLSDFDTYGRPNSGNHIGAVWPYIATSRVRRKL
jgi:hypothetical protein